MIEFGKVIEYDLPIEKQFDLFVMTSYYYICQIESQMGIQHLEKYESEFGFTPEWISIEDALAVNQTLYANVRENFNAGSTAKQWCLQILLNEYAGR